MATHIQPKILLADELGDLLAQVIHGVAGGTVASWQNMIGTIERMPAWIKVSHNRRVASKGTVAQRDTVERAAAIVRIEHPYSE